MTGVWARARAEFRGRWRATLGLALLVGIAGGGVIAAAAGARRTDSAYPRFLRATQAPDVAMPIFPWLPIARFDVRKVAEIPQVAAVDVITNYFVSDGPTVGASADPGLIRRLVILEGRRPRPDRTDELVVGFTAAEILGLKLGETFPVRFQGFGKPRSMDFRVVGISASAADFPPIEESVPTWSAAYATPAFHAAFADKLSHFELIAARLHRGAADLPAFEKELQRAVGERGYFILRERDHAAGVQRSVHLQAVALWLLAGLLAVAALLTLGQALARQMFLESVDHPVLRALGMTRTQLWALGMARAGLVAVAGAAVATGVGLLLSPLTPIGLARLAEPSRGFSLDAGVFGAGIAATMLLVASLAAWPAWRAARAARAGLAAAEPSGQQRPSVLANSFARSGFPPTAVAGVRLALEPGRGHTALPVRTTIAGVTLGIMALTVAFGFGSSLTHLEGTPRLYGVTADTAFFIEDGAASIAGELRSDPRIEALSVGSGGYPIVVGDVPILAMAQEGTVMPPILEGRAPGGPRADREILLGSETLRAVGARVGDEVQVRVQGSRALPLEMRIVGRAVFPPVTATVGLGRGALVSLGAARALVGEVAPGDEPPTFDNELTVRFAPGIDKRAAFEELRRRLDSDARLGHPLPTDLVNFGRVEDMPIVLAGVLAAFATATLAHALVSSIRRRRRDLAILKTLGFVRGQVRRTVGWQATTIIAVALVVGLPLGLAAARWAWSVFANQIGIVSEPDVWWPPVLATIPAMLVLANLLAAIPGRIAARLKPAVVLRTE